jgi:hypothetical protein
VASWEAVDGFLLGKGFERLGDNGYQGEIKGHGDGRTQLVFVAKYDAEGDVLDSLVFHSPFAKVGTISAETALSLAPLMYGVAEFAGHYCLRDSVQIADLSESEIMVPAIFMSKLADALEQKISGADNL